MSDEQIKKALAIQARRVQTVPQVNIQLQAELTELDECLELEQRELERIRRNDKEISNANK